MDDLVLVQVLYTLQRYVKLVALHRSRGRVTAVEFLSINFLLHSLIRLQLVQLIVAMVNVRYVLTAYLDSI